MRMALENGCEHESMTAGHVAQRVDAFKRVRVRNGRTIQSRQRSHCIVEDLRSLRIAAEEFERRLTRNFFHYGLTGPYRVLDAFPTPDHPRLRRHDGQSAKTWRGAAPK